MLLPLMEATVFKYQYRLQFQTLKHNIKNIKVK